MALDRERLALGRYPAAASDARQHVSDFCIEMPADLRATAQLLTSELVTNALIHGSGEIEMQMSADAETFRVEVSDQSPTPPQRVRHSSASTSGRGMMLVERLAARWGVNQHPGDGKAVWFVLRRT